MYLWMVIVGTFFCVAMAWGIGANDIANFFGPAIGAKSISLRNGMLLAFVFEFIGAFFLGATVTKTIRKSIVDFDTFDGEADLLMLGMFSSLIAASLWVYLATKYSLPVSTTQSIVGAIVGFSLVAKGPDAIVWDTLIQIILFWVFTPLLGCVSCLILYTPTRHFVLNKEGEASYRLTLKLYPLFVFLVVAMMSTFLLFKGFKRDLGDWTEANPGFTVLIGMGIGAVAALAAYLGLIRTGYAARYAEKEQSMEKEPETAGDARTEDVDAVELKKVTSASVGDTDKEKEKEKDIEAGMEKGAEKLKLEAVGDKLKSGLNVNIFDDLSAEEQAMQDSAAVFDPRLERLFEWLSVLAAVFATFAHGSNDIANAIAPLSSIVALSEQKPGDAISEKSDVQTWVLLLGSVAMSVGCVTYGYNVIKTMGVKLAKMSPSRGYFTQVSAALVIIFGSNYGFPASTTHCQVGATVGLGLIEKLYNRDTPWSKVFNWKLLAIVFFGWIGTIVIAGASSALIFSVMAYSPCADTS